MSDLGLGIEYSDVLEAIKAVTNLEDSYARMVQQIIAENNRLKVLEKNADLRAEAETRALKKIEDAAQKHHTKMLNEEMAFRKRLADQKARELESDRQAMLRGYLEEKDAQERALQSYLNLAGRYDPLQRATNELAKAQEILNEALRRGVISADQYRAQLAKVQEATLHGAADFNQFGAKALWSGKNLGFFGQQIQQGGYQLQDFIVQVSNGTSVFTALGQQGSQFAGIFGPGGAVVGAIIAIGSVIGGMAMAALSAKKEQKDLAEEFKKTSGSMQESAKRLSDVFVNDLRSAIGSTNEALKDFLETWAKVDAKAFKDAALAVKAELIVGVTSNLPTGLAGQLSGQTMTQYKKPATAEEEHQLAVAKELLDIYWQIGGVTDTEWAASIAEANRQLEKSTVLSAKELETEQKRLIELSNRLGIQDTLDREAAESAKKRAQDKAANEAYVNALIEKYAAQQEAFQRRVAVAYQTYAASRAKGLADEQAKWEAYSQAQIDKSVAMQRLAEDRAAKEVTALADAYKYMADTKSTTEDIIALNLAGAFDLAAGSASKIADELRKAMSPAMAIADLIAAANGSGGLARYFTLEELNRNSGGRGLPGSGGPTRNWEMPAGSNRPKPKPEDSDLDGLPGVSKDAKKGGGSKKTTTDRLAELEKEYQQRLKMAGLFGEQLKQEEAYQVVTKAVGDDIGKYSEEFLRAKAAELAATQELIDLEASRKEIYDTVESSMTDMFMSMADGTKSVKEAFSDMARSIISELYKVLVVKQAVNAIMGFVGVSGLIPGMSGGSNTVTKVNDAVISPKGQIISTSPEDFLIATKRPQDLAKAAAGGTNSVSEGGVVVNQSFNISGSDQATVQQALARAMPAIVTATKSAIVDARKRGSSELRGAFG